MGSRYPRIVERLIGDELLAEFPALLVVGPRGSGKSTSAAVFGATIVDLSRPGPRRAAADDPDGLLAAARAPVVVDEWQEEPEIVGAVKRAVDADLSRSPGRFILTGSTRAGRGARTWPGTGRLIRVRMFGLTQAEIEHDNTFNPVDALFAPELPHWSSCDLTRTDYIERIVAGRLPEPLTLGQRNRTHWFESYVDQLAELDAPMVVGGSPRAQKVRDVLGSCAARTALVLNKQATARDAGTTHATADAHLRLLEDLSIITRVPAWHSRRIQRLTRHPKVHIIDPGLAAHLLETDSRRLILDATLVGQLVETFVVSELLPHLQAAQERTAMFHCRDNAGHEVDILLERAGRVVALEVKSSTAVDRRDARNLLWLRDQLGDDFCRGAVLYTGKYPFRIDDRIWALPIGTLWRSASRPAYPDGRTPQSPHPLTGASRPPAAAGGGVSGPVG